MQLALYKGPAGTIWQKLVHWGICAFDTVRQTLKQRRLVLVRYSHCELVIDGRCYSSSDRDGGVRGKSIDLRSGHWDVFPIAGDATRALAWFREHDGENYDWVGILRFLVPALPPRARHWFCSAACAAALGLDLEHPSPYDLLQVRTDNPYPQKEVTHG